MNIEKLKRLAEAALWTGRWYDGGCETLMGTYGDDSEACEGHGEVAHPVPPGIVPYLVEVQPAAVLELIAEVEYLRGKNREHFDACIGCDEELKRVTKQGDELLAALKSYRSARAMPSYGDYASIQWESQQGPTNPVWGGGDCKKHGRWYGHCHCCASDWDKLKKQADQDAVHARDNALRKADTLAAEAIKKIEG